MPYVRLTQYDVAMRKATTRHGKKWSSRVTKESNALDLDHGVFTWKDPKRIARSR